MNEMPALAPGTWLLQEALALFMPDKRCEGLIPHSVPKLT